MLFGVADHLLYPHRALGASGDGHVRALVVRTPLRNFLRTRTQAGYRHQNLHGEVVLAVIDLADKGHVIVQQTLHARYRGGLIDKVREAHLDVARLRLQLIHHLTQDTFE